MKTRHIASLTVALALVITGAICFFGRETAGCPQSVPDRRPVRSVRLASRTVSVGIDGRSVSAKTPPEMPSVLSSRGTAPFLVVSKDKVVRSVRERVSACGAVVNGVVPPYGIVVEADRHALDVIAGDGSFIAVESLLPADKTARSLKEFVSSGADRIPVSVVPVRKDDSCRLERALVAMGAESVETAESDVGIVRAVVPADLVSEIAGRGDVRWMERSVNPRFLTDVAVKPGLLNVAPVWETYGLTGRGQYVTVSDSGLDTGDADTVMADFSGRIGFIRNVGYALGYDQLGHGTHVAGIVAGDGSLSGGRFKGVAPEAMLNFFQCADAEGGLWLPAYTYRTLFSVSSDYPSYIHSASWGFEVPSEYCSECFSVDSYLWSNPSVLAVFAAGNTNVSTAVKVIFSPAGAKNVIAVGATKNYRRDKGSWADNPSQRAYFSCRGPMQDGRIKPDVCAPGTYIVSTRSTKTSNSGWGVYPEFDGKYMYNSGTSMATPFVSGSAALVRQWLVEKRCCADGMPSAALMKAILTGGAHDMSSDSGANCGGAAPNSTQGWGRVDVGQSLYPTNATVMLVDRIPFSDGSEYSFCISVTNAEPLSVQLVWTDYPGTLGAERDIVNDLDVIVSNETTGAVWYGNGTDGGDRTNTVESVRIPEDEMSPGVYHVVVKGHDVIYDSTEGGAAALYVRGSFSDKVRDEWNGSLAGEMKVRTCIVLSSLGDYRWQTVESRVAKGETAHFSVPGSIPGGSESVDLSSYGEYYEDEDGSARRLKVQRLGRIEIADPDVASGTVVTNAAGHMATSFTVAVDADKDVLFKFYDERSVNVATSLPTWWYRRYVEGDPLADTVRFTSVSPTRVEWTGGAAHSLTLERSAALGPDADWRSVYECSPSPVLTNGWTVPAEFSTNSFFRIR